MSYSMVFSESLRLVWRRKSLIGLGFLSVLTTSLAYLAMYVGFVAAFFSSGFFSHLFIFTAEDIGLPVNTGLAGLAIILSALAWLLLWFVGLAARGGLIAAVDDSEQGLSTTFGGAFGRGWRRVLPLAVMAFLLFLPVIILSLISQAILLVFMPEFTGFNGEEVGDTFLTLFAISCSFSVLTYGLMAILQFIYAFAFRGVVLGGLGVMASIRHGWRVLRDHIGDILPLAFIFGGILVALVVLWYMAFFAIYFVLLFTLATDGGDVFMPMLVVVGVTFLALLMMTLFGGALYRTWRSAAFTIGYRQWLAEKLVDRKVEESTGFTDGKD